MVENNKSSIISKFLTLSVEIGFLVPFIALSKLMIVVYLLDLPFKLEAFSSMALVTIPVYFGDRLFVDEEDKNNQQKTLRNRLVSDYYPHLFLFVVLSILSFWYITWTHLHFWAFISVQFPFFIFAMYPFLKKVRHLDTIAIATAWSVELILVSTLFSGSLFDVGLLEIVSVTLIMFIMKMAETELSNIRDMEGDIRAGNETLAVIYPLDRVRKLVALGPIVSLSGVAYMSDSLIISLFAIFFSVLISFHIYSVTPSGVRNVIFIDRSLKILLAMIVVGVMYI